MNLIKYRLTSLINIKFLMWNIAFFVLMILYQEGSVGYFSSDDFQFTNLLLSKFTLTYVVLPILTTMTIVFYRDEFVHKVFIEFRKCLKIEVLLYVVVISLLVSIEMLFASMIALNFQVRFNMIFLVTACMLIAGNFTISLIALTLYISFLNRAISLVFVNLMVFIDFVLMQGGKWNYLIIDSKRFFSLSWSWTMYQLLLIIFLYLVVEWIISKKEIRT
ncbi:hypothetical protein [Mammaliicoccus fleurettii]|uniref:hypothetical protein n=1 Tax=Mammaliicoccus fleurettii TaxID=150056 RepID=UPI0009945C2A|nr:hypothetical protein [Mammaliicoccus fleurettii]OOV76228.1 hypothetical protein B2G86_10490 [Mammaliicoccus fleurettii]